MIRANEGRIRGTGHREEEELGEAATSTATMIVQQKSEDLLRHNGGAPILAAETGRTWARKEKGRELGETDVGEVTL